MSKYAKHWGEAGLSDVTLKLDISTDPARIKILHAVLMMPLSLSFSRADNADDEADQADNSTIRAPQRMPHRRSIVAQGVYMARQVSLADKLCLHVGCVASASQQ